MKLGSFLDEERGVKAIQEEDEEDCLSKDDEGAEEDDEPTIVGEEFSTSPSAADAPEKLIAKENLQARLIKACLITVLIVATVATTILVYTFARSFERKTYNAAFEAVSSRLVNSISNDLYLKFQIARTLSNALELAMSLTPGADPVTFLLADGVFGELSVVAFAALNAPIVNWSPFLFNDKDRQRFEDLARNKAFTVGPFPQCSNCGNTSLIFSNPEQVFAVPGFGQSSCGESEVIGMTGSLPPQLCDVIIKLTSVDGPCQCVPLPPDKEPISNIVQKPEKIYQVNLNLETEPVPLNNAPYFPTWQLAALGARKLPVMFDQASNPERARALKELLVTKSGVLSSISSPDTNFFVSYSGFPNEIFSTLYYPIFNATKDVVAGISLEIRWATFISGALPSDSDLVDVVVEDKCSQNYTMAFNMETGRAVLQQKVPQQNPGILKKVETFDDFRGVIRQTSRAQLPPTFEPECSFAWHIYSSKRMEDKYLTTNPIRYAIITACIFLFTTTIFILYDVVVKIRDAKVMESAKRTNDIVSTLFPEDIRRQLYKEANAVKDRPSLQKIDGYLSTELDSSRMTDKPIANLFPSATVMVLEIVGFRAWCSERDAWHCFTLLEQLYTAFDRIAEAMGVFKVESRGGTYICACGIPKERSDHAVIIVKYAKRCLREMLRIVRSLEVQLGPLTGDLRARVGLHSGPVIAGVLRGAKARFQLFGETTITAAEMEANGAPHRIHASKATADLLIEKGKGGWVKARGDTTVIVPGKGHVETCFVSPNQLRRSSGASTNPSMSGASSNEETFDDSLDRLVDFDTEVLFKYLSSMCDYRSRIVSHASGKTRQSLGKTASTSSHRPINEVGDVVEIPPYISRESHGCDKDFPLAAAKKQLRSFVALIAQGYNDVPFHNFMHCSHVVMSTDKLLTRILHPFDTEHVDEAMEKEVYKTTYGISGDAQMHFAAVFAALIHDVGHTGLTNAELIEAQTDTAQHYGAQSVAEQNSIDIAWALLTENEQFPDLRACIYANEDELLRFRRLVVQAVIATDIADKELKANREMRWQAVFKKEALVGDLKASRDRKATIVFEYLLQASDVCHMTQHWNTYQKFNRRLFHERYLAWKKGHLKTHPADGWYGGELWFFDNYVLPTAFKLKTCGVFGATHNEFVAYGTENRHAWMAEGKHIVESFRVECEQMYGNALDQTFDTELWGEEVNI